jgi:hypothetical protein
MIELVGADDPHEFSDGDGASGDDIRWHGIIPIMVDEYQTSPCRFVSLECE